MVPKVGDAERASKVKVAALPAILLHEMNVLDDHPLVYGLAHVIDREACDRCAGQRFHLNPGLPLSLHRAERCDRTLLLVDREGNLCVCEI